MNQVDERVDSIEHLDFKPTCTLRRDCTKPDECGKEAAWASMFRCCGGVFLQCEEHVNGTGRGVNCRCGVEWLRWTEAVLNRWRL